MSIRTHLLPHLRATGYYTMAGLDEFVAMPVEVFADPAFPGPSGIKHMR